MKRRKTMKLERKIYDREGNYIGRESIFESVTFDFFLFKVHNEK